jgi:prolyl 4-hydroxylase
MKGLVPKEACQSIIEIFESNPKYHYSGTLGTVDGYFVDRSKKEDTEMTVYNDSAPWMIEYLKIGIEQYKKDYPSVDNVAPWAVENRWKIQRYCPNEAYHYLHFENPMYKETTANRVLAWMIYLNDVTEGGETEFPDQGKKFQPRVGDLLIWPAYFTHPHRGIASKTQTKYIATSWISVIDKLCTK